MIFLEEKKARCLGTYNNLNQILINMNTENSTIVFLRVEFTLKRFFSLNLDLKIVSNLPLFDDELSITCYE